MKCNNSVRLFCLLFLLYLAGFSYLLYAQNPTRVTLTLYFPFNSYSLSKTELAKLDSSLHKYAFTGVSLPALEITGYTDSAGTGKYNRTLSVQRCRSVNDFIQRMVPRGKSLQVHLLPMGELGAGKQTDSLDRRVTVVLYYPPGKPLAQEAVVDQNERTLTNEKTEQNKLERKDKIVDTVILLDHLYFEPDLPILTPGSVSTLPHYISILKKYKNNDMEIGGHVNHTDSKLKETDPLFKLSEKRAELVYQYLIDYGFDPAKLSYKGYGNSRLLFAKPRDMEEKRKNMRVEITVFKALLPG